MKSHYLSDQLAVILQYIINSNNVVGMLIESLNCHLIFTNSPVRITLC